MLALTLLAALAVLDSSCLALGGLRYVRPPPVRNVARRSGVESIEDSALAQTETNTSSSSNAAIVPAVYSPADQTYYSVVSTGNASFRVALDSGSADFWLVSSACTDDACSVPKYQVGYQSPTFVPINGNQTAFNISFADGTAASGFVALEDVQVANLTVPQQALGLVNSSDVVLQNDVSGVLGLGFPRLSRIFSSLPNGTGTPFFATMAQRGQLAYPLFGLSLTLNSSGSLTLGAVDGSVVTNLSLIQWNEVVPFAPSIGSASNTSSYLQWVIPLSSIQVNGTALTPQPTYPNATSNTSLALLDAGTPGIYGPYTDVARIYSAIAGSRLVDATGQWVIPCDANDTMAFQFGTHTYLMQPTDYLIGPTTETPDLCLSWPKASPPSTDGVDWQLGTAFLRTVYSVFSYGINRKEPPMIGLYPLRNGSASVQSPDIVEAFFSSVSATVTTDLPNFLLPTPSISAPPYAFNASITAPQGKVVQSGLATSTYSPALLTANHINQTAILTVSPSPTILTFVITTNGELITSISAAATPSLGQPPGWTSGSSRLTTRVPTAMTLLAGTVTLSVIMARFAL
ncbi:aspartic peptidase domain-containing protein [Cytidiella melzeri]|nr:aspartic peptidase domain-containing protein [Cytidiella melzeri]